MAKTQRFEAVKRLLLKLSKFRLQVKLAIIVGSLLISYFSALRSAIAFDLGEWARNAINDAYSRASSSGQPPQRIQNPSEQRDYCAGEIAAQSRLDQINQRASAAISVRLSPQAKFLLKDLAYPQQIQHIKKAIGEPTSTDGDDLIYGSVRLYVVGNRVTGAIRR